MSDKFGERIATLEQQMRSIEKRMARIEMGFIALGLAAVLTVAKFVIEGKI